MKTLEQHLANYAAYHRNPRNVATHFIGIPLILLAAESLLARSHFVLLSLTVTPLIIAILACTLYYVIHDLRLGLGMLVVLCVLAVPASWLATQNPVLWLGGSVGIFVVGWIFQFIGHAVEGRKPAFFDDLASLLIGPVFLLAEACLALGLRKELAEALGKTPSSPAIGQ